MLALEYLPNFFMTTSSQHFYIQRLYRLNALRCVLKTLSPPFQKMVLSYSISFFNGEAPAIPAAQYHRPFQF
jgi:hypothetical protein